MFTSRHVSGVMCHIFFWTKQKGGASRGRICYQRGLPRLHICSFDILIINILQLQVQVLQVCCLAGGPAPIYEYCPLAADHCTVQRTLYTVH